MTVEIARHWRLNSQRYSLIGEECPACHYKIFPPRDVCPHCAEEAGPEFHFSGNGTVFSHTTVHTPPEGFEAQSPYTVALVKLDEGPMITAQLTDVDNGAVEIGLPVEMVTRKLAEQGDEGLILYGYKFRPQMAMA
ncbi:MAG TPA: Zn-ribbon domain-containing OB-fold protein [Chloroflexi bacterium]|nr:MAG: transcriptional regulator [Anaerolineaceae bacterium 4572_5.2]HEY83650.1 Zn-ribbon domain-containing OB-fold protein [Chloroflexota bacterium]